MSPDSNWQNICQSIGRTSASRSGFMEAEGVVPEFREDGRNALAGGAAPARPEETYNATD